MMSNPPKSILKKRPEPEDKIKEDEKIVMNIGEMSPPRWSRILTSTLIPNNAKKIESDPTDSLLNILPFRLPKNHEHKDSSSTSDELNIRKRLSEFISKKSDLLFRPLDSYELPIDIGTQEKTENHYGIMPSLELFLNPNPIQSRRDLFFRNVKKGDRLLAKFSNQTSRGLFLTLLFYENGSPSLLADLSLPDAFCPLRDALAPVHPSYPDKKEWSVKDIVRVEFLSGTPDRTKMWVGMRGVSLNEEERETVRLGLVPFEEGLPAEYRVTYNEYKTRSKKSYDELLEETFGFQNPNAVKYLADSMGILHNRNTLMTGLRGVWPENENCVSLEKVQNGIEAHNYVSDGIRYFKNGNLVEAAQCLNKALSIDATNVEGLVARGALYANKGSFERAIEDFEAARKVNPDHLNAKKYMIETYIALGQELENNHKTDEAIGAYSSCLKANADFQPAKDALWKIHEKLKGLELNRLNPLVRNKTIENLKKIKGILQPPPPSAPTNIDIKKEVKDEEDEKSESSSSENSSNDERKKRKKGKNKKSSKKRKKDKKLSKDLKDLKKEKKVKRKSEEADSDEEDSDSNSKKKKNRKGEKEKEKGVSLPEFDDLKDMELKLAAYYSKVEREELEQIKKSTSKPISPSPEKERFYNSPRNSEPSRDEGKKGVPPSRDFSKPRLVSATIQPEITIEKPSGNVNSKWRTVGSTGFTNFNTGGGKLSPPRAYAPLPPSSQQQGTIQGDDRFGGTVTLSDDESPVKKAPLFQNNIERRLRERKNVFKSRSKSGSKSKSRSPSKERRFRRKSRSKSRSRSRSRSSSPWGRRGRGGGGRGSGRGSRSRPYVRGRYVDRGGGYSSYRGGFNSNRGGFPPGGGRVRRTFVARRGRGGGVGWSSSRRRSLSRSSSRSPGRLERRWSRGRSSSSGEKESSSKRKKRSSPDDRKKSTDESLTSKAKSDGKKVNFVPYAPSEIGSKFEPSSNSKNSTVPQPQN